MNNYRIAFCMLFFVFYSAVSAQTTTKQAALSKVLSDLESVFSISFSYLDADVKGIIVSTPSDTQTFSEVLNRLETETQLSFIPINEKTIVIQKKKGVENSSEQLNEVLIHHYLAKGIQLKKNGSIRITPKEFDILPGLVEPDVFQTLQALPGITSSDETVSNLSIRGGTNDQNLVLWDGIKMYQSGHFFGMISAFDPYSIQSVTVSKNGTVAQFGDGVSGTINMQVHQNTPEQVSGGAGLNLIHTNALLHLPVSKKASLHLSARRSLTDLLSTLTYEQYFNRIFQDTDVTSNEAPNRSITTNKEFYFYDVTASGRYQLSNKEQLRVSFITIYNDLNYLEKSASNAFLEQLESGLSQRSMAGALHYKKHWSPAFTSEVSAHISSYLLKGKNFDPIHIQLLQQQNEVLDTGIHLDTNLNLDDFWTLKNGYHFNETGISNVAEVNRPAVFDLSKEVLRTHTMYSEASYESLKKATRLTFGVRGTFFENFNNYRFEPRLSLSRKFLKNFRIEVLGELKNQSRTQIIDQPNDFLGIEKRRWMLANEGSRPIIKSEQISVGLHYTKKGWLASVEGFLKNVEGITSRSQGFQNQFQFTNAIGSYTVSGLDLLLYKKWMRFNFRIGYSLSRNVYAFESLYSGDSFPNNTDIRHNITYSGTYTYQNFNVALGFNWHSGIPETAALSLNERTFPPTIVYGAPNASNLDGYFRTDLSATYRFKLSTKMKANVGVSVWNVFNHQSIINRYYSVNGGSIEEYRTASLGITPNASFRITF